MHCKYWDILYEWPDKTLIWDFLVVTVHLTLTSFDSNKVITKLECGIESPHPNLHILFYEPIRDVVCLHWFWPTALSGEFYLKILLWGEYGYVFFSTTECIYFILWIIRGIIKYLHRIKRATEILKYYFVKQLHIQESSWCPTLKINQLHVLNALMSWNYKSSNKNI